MTENEINQRKEHNIKNLEVLEYQNDIDRVTKEHHQTFISNRCHINFGDLLCKVIKRHHNHIKKTHGPEYVV